ncbi:MAG: hypothetical protein ACYTGC_15295, partial [Planctomycetota bacterium]
MSIQLCRAALTGAVVGFVTAPAIGGVLVFTDREAWEAAVGSFSTIDFTEIPLGTIATDHYRQSHGVTFTGGFDYVEPGTGEDGAGLDSSSGLRGQLDAPLNAVAVKIPPQEMVQIVLFCEGYEAFFMSAHFSGDAGDFLGVVSTEAFYAFVVRGEGVPFSSVRIDDLFLGDATGATVAPCADEPLIGSDLLAAGMYDVQCWGSMGGISAFSFASDYCNIGDAVEPVVPLTSDHPVFTTNLYRLMNGRFEHVGMGWVKHTWGADIDTTCGSCEEPGSLQILGVGCSDVYGSGQNGDQANYPPEMSGLGPRSDINPSTGQFAFPYTTQGVTGDVLYKRLQVRDDELEPSLNPGASYFGELHFIGAHDAQAGNGTNNMCYQPIVVGKYGELLFTDDVRPGRNPLEGWQEFQPTVFLQTLDVPGDGRLVLGFDCTDDGEGTWHYEYALYNLNSHRAAGSFAIPIDLTTTVTNIGFHDVDYHSGEIYDGTNWSYQLADGLLTWATQPFEENENANAVRWATVYNFRFDADVAPTAVTAALGLFRPGDPEQLEVAVLAPGEPVDCNGNGVP